ncbi:hypothetical protein JCM10212_001871 [Sporobolomyces blumeae]
MSGDGDPAAPIEPPDGTLPPWIWLTLSTLSLCCLLFISFRRAKSIELYDRAARYLRSRLPRFVPGSLHRSIHLDDSSTPGTSRSRAAASYDLTDADDDDDDDDDDDEGDSRPTGRRPRPPRTTAAEDDELPFAALSPRTATLQSVQRRTRSMARSLGSNVVDGMFRVGEGLGWLGREGSIGLQEILTGRRDVDQIGRIRLGDEASGLVERGQREHRDVGSRREGQAARRARDAGRDRGTDAGARDDPATLFEVGDAEDGAVELPASGQFPFR